MKTKNIFFLACSLMLMLLTFSACSDDDEKEGKGDKSELIGTWTSQEEGAITFYEDGTCFWGTDGRCEYVYRDGILRVDFGDNEILEFEVTIKKGKLTLVDVEYPDDIYVFYKDGGSSENPDEGASVLVGTWKGYDIDGESIMLVFRKDGTCNADGDEAEYTYNSKTKMLVLDYGDSYPDELQIISLTSTKMTIDLGDGDTVILRKQ